MTAEKQETAADKAIREALASVERLEQEGQAARDNNDRDDDDSDAVTLTDDEPAPLRGSFPAAKSAHEATIEALLAAKHENEAVLGQTQKEAKDMFDRLTRLSADFDNYKKRQQREREDAIKFGNEKLLKEMLPVLDNLRRALHASTGVPVGDEHPLLSGVKLVAKQFDDVLGRFGVVGFAAIGELFDPARHEAVGSRSHPTVPAQHVCEEFQLGFLLQDRLLRPALVIVSTGPADVATAPEVATAS
jgi:molecular chaperone GrpE